MSAAEDTRQRMLTRALAALKVARRRLEEVERSRQEPLAIVGMGCRFPGGSSSPPAYWSLIHENRDGVIDVPRDRWPLERFFDEDPATRGRMRFRQAGFIDDVDAFDAGFFEISPREAERMDPQQRLLLQVAWEAIDDAGLDAAALAGSSAGVWVGVNSHDYLHLQLRDPDLIDTYTLTGGTSSIVANRISYLLDLHGPSLTVDTACSTSLVAVHLACQSLRAGECDVALVGAVNLILSPFSAMAHARGMPFARDHRCKTFDARADGYVRGEGCGVVLLKRLSDAARDRDAIWAVIRGSAVNQDGRTNGMTAPNGLSQQEVIRRALEVGSIEPASVGYVEAHGTGTELGDPIEVEALQQVYGRDRERPCALGAVKANIGHLESASGMAGLIKMALALHHGQIPAVHGFERLNPHIDLGDSRFTVPTEHGDWTDPVRRGAVSSFGAGGTNAHVVLEQSPPEDATPTPEPSSSPRATDGAMVLLSARDEAGLRRSGQAWLAWLRAQEHPMSLADLAYTTVRRRTRHEHRAAIWARDAEHLGQRLCGWLAREPDDDVVMGHAPGGRRRIVFVCPGQGAQWVGMARDLLAREPVFRASIEACGAAIAEHVGWSLLERLQDDAAPFDRIDVIQPTLWAIMVALAAQWAHLGVRPDAVIGHSMGETAAAAISGALSLSDAARVICRRSRLLLQAAGRGLMLLIGEPAERVRSRIDAVNDRVSIAVCNSPGTTVISGDPEAIAGVEAELARDGVFHRRIAVDVASHSPQMDPLAAALRAELSGIVPRVPTVPMLSTVDLEMVSGETLDEDYWVRNLREPVRFGEATERLIFEGHDVFVELSPHPVLGAAIEQTTEALASTMTPSVVVVPSMLRDSSGVETMRRAWAGLLASGCTVELGAWVPKHGRVVRGPTLPWLQRSYWFCDDRWAALGGGAGAVPPDPTRARLRAASHRLEWVARPDAPARASAGPWWILGTDAAWCRALSTAFEEAGEVARVLSELPLASDPRWDEDPCGLLDLRAPAPGAGGADDAVAAAQHMLETLQCLRRVHAASPRPWWVTRGAQGPTGATPAAAAPWGLGRAVAIEHVGAWGGLLDLPVDAAPRAIAARVVDALRRDDREDQLRLDHDGRVLVPRVVADDTLSLAPAGLVTGPDRSILVVGRASGALATVIEALHEREPGSILWLDEGTDADPTVSHDALALAHRVTQAVVESVLEQRAQHGRPVTGVVRLPAPARACALRDLNASTLEEVIRAQAGAVERLLALVDASVPELEDLVLVSTVAASWGSMAMGHEGAAGAYLAAVARRRRDQGRPCALVEFTPWAGGDMVGAQAQQLGERLGVEPVPPELAMAAVVRAGRCSSLETAVAMVDWARLRPAYEANRRRPQLGILGQPRTSDADDQAFLEALRAEPPAARVASLRAHLGQMVADLLRYSPGELDLEAGFFQLGMDSIMAMQLRRRLVAAMGQPIPATAIFEHPSVARLAGYLLQRLGLEDEESVEPDREADELHELLAEANALSESELLQALELELR